MAVRDLNSDPEQWGKHCIYRYIYHYIYYIYYYIYHVSL